MSIETRCEDVKSFVSVKGVNVIIYPVSMYTMGAIIRAIEKRQVQECTYIVWLRLCTQIWVNASMKTRSVTDLLMVRMPTDTHHTHTCGARSSFT